MLESNRVIPIDRNCSFSHNERKNCKKVKVAMKKVKVLLVFGLILSSSLNCLDPEISNQEELQEKKDHFINAMQQEPANCQHIVDRSKNGDHPILDSIEKAIPNGSFKRYIVVLLLDSLRQLQGFKNRYKKLKDSVICYHHNNDQKMAQLSDEIERLKRNDQEKQKEIQQLKYQAKQSQQIIHSIAKEGIFGG